MYNSKKTSPFTLYTTLFLFSLLLFSTSCSKEEDQNIEVTEPLSCLYPGDLTLNQQTKNALSNYKEQPLQEKLVEDK
jgi:outer membrane protein assembly factor BamD (BamD/ComL family)